MAVSRLWLIVVAALFALALAVSEAWGRGHYMALSLMLLAASMLPFYLRFERRKLGARELILIAVLAAIASMGRVAFAPLPSVKPTSFVVIVAACVFGGETGFLIGSVAALVSNIFLGQGPWTAWQMFCWGMVGATAGWLRGTWLLRTRIGRALFGFAWGFLFGWIMNIWYLIGFAETLSWPVLLAAGIQSFYFDLAHALTNVFFLVALGDGWIRVLTRFKKKYGLLRR